MHPCPRFASATRKRYYLLQTFTLNVSLPCFIWPGRYIWCGIYLWRHEKFRYDYAIFFVLNYYLANVKMWARWYPCWTFGKAGAIFVCFANLAVRYRLDFAGCCQNNRTRGMM
ncbi:hypothetical protein F5887DRAFT_1000319, partial [Amanita rubescens]